MNNLLSYRSRDIHRFSNDRDIYETLESINIEKEIANGYKNYTILKPKYISSLDFFTKSKESEELISYMDKSKVYIFRFYIKEYVEYCNILKSLNIISDASDYAIVDILKTVQDNLVRKFLEIHITHSFNDEIIILYRSSDNNPKIEILHEVISRITSTICNFFMKSLIEYIKNKAEKEETESKDLFDLIDTIPFVIFECKISCYDSIFSAFQVFIIRFILNSYNTITNIYNSLYPNSGFINFPNKLRSIDFSRYKDDQLYGTFIFGRKINEEPNELVLITSINLIPVLSVFLKSQSIYNIFKNCSFSYKFLN